MVIKSKKIVYILSNSRFCADLLEAKIGEFPEFVVSGVCDNPEDLNKLFYLLKIDLFIVISSDKYFIESAVLNFHYYFPLIIICPSVLFDDISNRRKKYIEDHIQFVSLDSKLDSLNLAFINILNSTFLDDKREDIRENISNRERDILQLILRGKKNKEIANELFLSVKTVENHRNNILKKTNYKSMILLLSDLYKIGFLK